MGYVTCNIFARGAVTRDESAGGWAMIRAIDQRVNNERQKFTLIMHRTRQHEMQNTEGYHG